MNNMIFLSNKIVNNNIERRDQAGERKRNYRYSWVYQSIVDYTSKHQIIIIQY